MKANVRVRTRAPRRVELCKSKCCARIEASFPGVPPMQIKYRLQKQCFYGLIHPTSLFSGTSCAAASWRVPSMLSFFHVSCSKLDSAAANHALHGGVRVELVLQSSVETCSSERASFCASDEENTCVGSRYFPLPDQSAISPIAFAAQPKFHHFPNNMTCFSASVPLPSSSSSRYAKSPSSWWAAPC